MSNYRTPDEVASLLFDDNQEDSSTSDRLNDDDDCSDYVSSDDDNKEYIILSDYDSEDNNLQKPVTHLADTLQTSLLHFSHQRVLESWAAELLLVLLLKRAKEIE